MTHSSLKTPRKPGGKPLLFPEQPWDGPIGFINVRGGVNAHSYAFCGCLGSGASQMF